MRVIIVPEDQTIIVDGVALKLSFACDSNIHAIQWYGDHGTIEKKVGGADWFNDASIITPFVTAFDARQAELAVEAALLAEVPA